MWTYSQTSGAFRGGVGTTVIVSRGYSGAGEGKNNPMLQAKPNVGPIPQGRWTITAIFDSAAHGPRCLRLAANPGTVTFGRDGFLIHGDSMARPGEASQGCIILPRSVREYVWQSGDRHLEVTA